MVHMYCECGCGQKTSIATKTRVHLGHVRGEPVRFVIGHSNILKTGKPYKKDRYFEEDRGYATPCWVWRLSESAKGYGWEWDNARGRMVAAHILAYERSYGLVPEGLELDHLCKVRLCVNPAHLEPVTHAENVRRGNYAGPNQRNTRKTHCPQGHAYAGDNLYLEQTPRGITRRCRACRAEYKKTRTK